MTPEQRSESARKAVRARWIKAKKGSDHKIVKRKDTSIKTFNRFRQKEISETASPSPVLDTSKKALHLCLKRLKIAKDQTEIEHLTEELQRIVFRKQYQNAED